MPIFHFWGNVILSPMDADLIYTSRQHKWKLLHISTTLTSIVVILTCERKPLYMLTCVFLIGDVEHFAYGCWSFSFPLVTYLFKSLVHLYQVICYLIPPTTFCMSYDYCLFWNDSLYLLFYFVSGHMRMISKNDLLCSIYGRFSFPLLPQTVLPW